MYEVWEYATEALDVSPRIFVRSFEDFDEACSYCIHPANLGRILTIAPETDRISA